MRLIIPFAALSWLASAVLPATALHRMPEVYIEAEHAELDEGPVTVLTFRMVAEDVLVLLADGYGQNVDLDDPAVLRAAGEQVLARVELEEGRAAYFGGEAEGDIVYLYAVAPKSVRLTQASVLSSVYNAWTNIYKDTRRDVPTRMFTQAGEVAGQAGQDHGH